MPQPNAGEGGPSPDPVGATLLPLINKLQDIFSSVGFGDTGIELPQVAAVGSQSGGKSSVLEALVGRDFLPRGPNICTRRPLVLQLVHRDDDDGEWGEFLHLPGRRFYDFAEIKMEILAETNKEAGGNKGVSDKQIRLKIFSPNVLNITLVDLPGITKVPVGDQPTDIEAKIRNMIMSYIKHLSCIILAVSPANADLANSDALQLARIADPDGSRTIGVITKLDIMDRGTDARNFLLGNIIPLKLGYVGVVNRSQEDINFNRSIKDALAFEEKFFSTLPAYHSLSHCCGIPQLAKKLNQILVQHIKALLPGLKSHINAQLVAVAKEHASYGEAAESKAGQGVRLLNILTKYCEAFASLLEGKDKVSTDELSGGARIHYIFQSIFVKSLEEVDPCYNITDEDIRIAIHDSNGPRAALFLSEVPFEKLVRRQVARLLDPSLQCAKFIYDELVKISHHCLVGELQRYPFLRKRMDETISNFLSEGLQPTETMITHLIEMEMDYINTSHPNFTGGSRAVEIAKMVLKSNKIAPLLPVAKDATDAEELHPVERSSNLRAIFARTPARGFLNNGFHSSGDSTRSGGTFGVTSSSEICRSRTENSTLKFNPTYGSENLPSNIYLSEPPITLRPPVNQTEEETIEIAIVKLLLKSYYDIVRKYIEDAVPKAIMHFLVNQSKRELHNVLIRRLYRENLFEEMLRETDEVFARRKRIQAMLGVLEQAQRALEELPLEADTIENSPVKDAGRTGLLKIHGLTSSLYERGDDFGAN